MSIQKCLDFSNFDKYPSEPNPTTNADMQEYLANQNDMVKYILKNAWQPNTQYVVNQAVFSENLPAGMYAIATTSGTSGTYEPAWDTSKPTSTTRDGNVFWKVKALFTELDNKYDKVSNMEISQGAAGDVSIKVNGVLPSMTFNKTTTEYYNKTQIVAGRIYFGNAEINGYTNTRNIGELKLCGGYYAYIRITDRNNPDDTVIELNKNPPSTSNSTEIATTRWVNDKQADLENDIESKLDKSDIADYIVEFNRVTVDETETKWYRKWKSGWLEQGGVKKHDTSTYYDIEFLKEFEDTNYTLNVTMTTKTDTGYANFAYAANFQACGKTNTGFRIIGETYYESLKTKDWYACGMGAND